MLPESKNVGFGATIMENYMERKLEYERKLGLLRAGVHGLLRELRLGYQNQECLLLTTLFLACIISSGILI